jgi:ATP-binding cassette subfamily B protein
MSRQRNIPEKPKNFKNSLSKLFKSLNRFKVFVIISLFLAFLGAGLALLSPNKLSDLVDEISAGLVINKDNLTLISTSVQKDLENISHILDIKLDLDYHDTLYSDNDIKLIESYLENPSDLTLLAQTPDFFKKSLVKESIYSGITFTVDDKVQLINYLNAPSALDNDLLSKIYTELKIDDVIITPKDKALFMKTIDINNLYVSIDKMPASIKQVLEPKINLSAIKKITILLVVLYVISAIFNFLQSLIMAIISNKHAYNLRKQIATKINKLPLKYFDNNLSGDTLSRVTNDVDTIAQTLNMSLSSLVAAFTLFIGSVIMMFITNYIMAFTAIIASLIGFVFMGKILKNSQKYFVLRQKSLGKINGHIEEVYSSLNIVKTYNGASDSLKKFKEYNKNVFEAERKSQFYSGLMHPIMMFVGNFGYVAVCIVGALLAINGHISFGVIVAFIMYARLFTNPMAQIAQGMTNLQSASAASERVFEFLEEKEMDAEIVKKKLSKVNGKVEFKNVSFGYDENKLIIKNFSVLAKKGQKIAIVGPTGAGKTTLVNLLMRFYEINSGDILIDDVSIHDLSKKNIRDMVTMVLQDTWVFNGTLKENIVYNLPNITDEKLKNACKMVGIDYFIKTLPHGFDTIIADNDSISSGQRQLITIARGILEDNPILILDEATSNVDTRTEELVSKAMDKMMEGKTAFVIAHRLSTIKNADLILVMKDGNIIEQGTHTELIKLNGFYADLYNSQFSKKGIVSE